MRYLLHLYSDPEYLERIISTSGEWTLRWTANGFYYMAPSGEIEKHRIFDAESAMLESEKPNGDSWFSAEAHVDAEVLKKEFRLLAKKYHPDVSIDPQASTIFQEISAELEKIQQELENQ